jgi:hypothetical protein
MELTIHAKIEEETFYPAREGKIHDDLLKEAYVEHDGAKVLIAQIEAGGSNDEYYDAKIKVLSEQIERHVEEEEKRMEGMFSQARKAGLDMDALGEQLRARREERFGRVQGQWAAYSGALDASFDADLIEGRGEAPPPSTRLRCTSRIWLDHDGGFPSVIWRTEGEEVKALVRKRWPSNPLTRQLRPWLAV